MAEIFFFPAVKFAFLLTQEGAPLCPASAAAAGGNRSEEGSRTPLFALLFDKEIWPGKEQAS